MTTRSTPRWPPPRRPPRCSAPASRILSDATEQRPPALPRATNPPSAAWPRPKRPAPATPVRPRPPPAPRKKADRAPGRMWCASTRAAGDALEGRARSGPPVPGEQRSPRPRPPAPRRKRPETEARSARADAKAAPARSRPEATALTRLLDRRAGRRRQDPRPDHRVVGFEAALGAALSDDLKAGEGMPSSARPAVPACRPMDTAARPLPAGARPITEVAQGARASGAAALADRPLSTGPRAQRLQPAVAPGQRLVSREGDPLWRWSTVCSRRPDARTSTAARRLEQVNRLAELRGRGRSGRQHRRRRRTRDERLGERLAALDTEADQGRPRRPSRRRPRGMADASRAQSRAEAERSVLGGVGWRRFRPPPKSPRRRCQGRPRPSLPAPRVRKANWKTLDASPRPTGRTSAPRSRAAADDNARLAAPPMTELKARGRAARGPNPPDRL